LDTAEEVIMPTMVCRFAVVIVCTHAFAVVQATPGGTSSSVDRDDAVLSSHYAAKGGTLKINDNKRKLAHLTLFGGENSSLDASLDFFPARDGSNKVDSFAYKPKRRSAPGADIIQPNFKPRFALLFAGAEIDADVKNNEADAAMLLNTSIISIKILDEVGYHDDPDTIKYLVRIGDVALHGSADGQVSPIDLSSDIRLNMDSVTLLIDSTEPDPKTKMLTDEQKKLSLMYQTKSGAVADAYTRTVQRVGAGAVSAQGFILGPLTFICCPLMVIESWIPLMWVFVPMKVICCWM